MLPTATVKLFVRAEDAHDDGSGYCDALTDQGPNAYGFTQVTGTARPQITTFGGKRSLLFDGTDDSLGCTSAASEWTVLHDGTAMHVFVVAAQTGAASKLSPWLCTRDGGTTSTYGAFYGSYTASNGKLLYSTANNTGTPPIQSNVGAVPDNQWMLLDYTVDAAAATKWASYVNGTLAASNTSFGSAPAANDPAGSLRIGRDRGASTVKAQGHWGESLICNGVQSGATLTQIRRYFAQKYGVTVA